MGGLADLVALNATDPAEAVATIAQPLWGVKRGPLSFNRPPPRLHPRRYGNCSRPAKNFLERRAFLSKETS